MSVPCEMLPDERELTPTLESRPWSRCPVSLTCSLPALWWAALLLLVVNDHILKGSGWLPSWMTGKLSDFAGLIVCPILLNALLQPVGRRAARAAFCLPVSVFVAINVSRDAAECVEMAAGYFGLSWHLWTDPTDLIALGVVGWSWRLSSGRLQSARLVEGFGLVAGAAACLASALPDGEYGTRVYTVNTSSAPLAVTVFLPRGEVDCPMLSEPETPLPPRDAYARAGTYHLEPWEVLPIDHIGWSLMGLDPSRDCGLARLQVGDEEALFSWGILQNVSLPEFIGADEPTLSTNAILLAEDSAYHLPKTSPIQRLDPEVDELPACSDRIGSSLEWAGFERSSTLVLRSLQVSEVGCLELTFAASSAILCVPEWAFPFEVGDSISEQETQGLSPSQGASRYVRFAKQLILSSSGKELVVRINWPLERENFVPPADCAGTVLDCGAYVVGGRARLEGFGDEPVAPGDVSEVSEGGRRTVTYLSRLERVLAASGDCYWAERQSGPQSDYLTLTTEEVPDDAP